MSDIYLSRNNGFCWQQQGNLFVKGYLLDGHNLLDYFKSLINFADFKSRLKQANGLFSVIVKRENEIWIATDRVRTFPLFYFHDNSELRITDEAQWLLKQLPQVDILNNATNEFLQSGYVSGNNTLIANIYQLQAGECLVWKNGQLNTYFYHYYLNNTVKTTNWRQLKNTLYEILTQQFSRLFDSLNAAPVVVPLSGGFDSRLIAVILKQLNYKDVTCFTFGKKGTEEWEKSQKVAEKLNFKWLGIEYTEKRLQNFRTDADFLHWFPYAANFSSTIYLQDYFAVKYLKNNRIIPENAIFLPGHSGDFLGGSHLKPELKNLQTTKQLAHTIYRQHYSFNSERKNKKLITKTIENQLIKAQSVFPESTGSLQYENWDLKERQAKYIVNSAHIFPFFGYSFRMPFWDKRLMDFFCQIPFHYKLHKKLYDNVLCELFFEPHHLLFPGEYPTKQPIAYFPKFKKKVKKHLPVSYKIKRIKQLDWKNYDYLTSILLDEIAKTDKNYAFEGDNFNAIIVKWYIEQVKTTVQKKTGK